MRVETIEDQPDGSAIITVTADFEELQALAAEAMEARIKRAADMVVSGRDAKLREALMKTKIAHSETWHENKKLRAALVQAVEALSHLMATDSVHPSKTEMTKEARDRGSKILWETPHVPV